MFKQSARVIGIVLKYARGAAVIKLAELLITGLMTPLSILFTKKLVDSVPPFLAGAGSVQPLLLYGGLLVFSMFFVATGGFFDGMLVIRLKRNLNQYLTPVIVEKFKRLDYACFEDQETQNTIERMSDDPQEHILNLFLNVTGVGTLLISMAGSAFIFLQVGIWYTVGFFALLFPMMWCDYKSRDMVNTLFIEQSTDERRMNYYGKLLSEKSSVLELRVFGGMEFLLKKWRSLTKVVLEERLKVNIGAQKYDLISTILFKTWSFFTIFSLIHGILGGSLTIGLFTALVGSSGTILDQANMLSHSFQNVTKRILLIRHFDAFLKLPEISRPENANSPICPEIVFDRVEFRYPGASRNILDGVTFTVRPGERVALVGENGAGKSTIIKLLCRLYRPDKGEIRIGGIALQELSQTQLKAVFSVVFQDFGCYELTLRENVALGAIEKLHDDDALYKALKQGLCEELGKDLDQPLGKLLDNGVDLSGGQWQRIALARAFVAESAFLILDEPTAALDPISESELYKGFSAAMKEKGAILISHRLACARISDRILVLDGGRVSEEGAHKELLAKGGLYARMWDAQSGWYQGGGENDETYEYADS